MKLRLKYGFKMLFRNPVRIAASLLAAIIALGIAGMCIFTLCYSAVDWERDLYFNHSDDKYTNIVIKVNAENGAGRYDRMSYDTYSALEQDIKEIGGGYATELTMSYAFTYDIQGRPTTSWAYGVSNLPNYFADTSAGTTIFSEYEGETLFAPHIGNWTGSSCVQGSADALIFDNVYAQMYKGHKGDHTIALMTLIDIALQYQKERYKNDTAPYNDILTRLTAEIEDALSDKR